jgi:hypothetical protein
MEILMISKPLLAAFGVCSVDFCGKNRKKLYYKGLPSGSPTNSWRLMRLLAETPLDSGVCGKQ